jgi:hypothetical protein
VERVEERKVIGIKIIGLGGSMASDSTSLAALEIALAGAEAAGAEIQLFNVREMNLPMFEPRDSRQSTRWNLRCEPCEVGPFRWSSQSRAPGKSLTNKARSAKKMLNGSCMS